MKSTIILMQKSDQDISKEINWTLHNRFPYVVRDPLDVDALEYLSEADYKKLMLTALANNLSIRTIARPGDSPESIAIKFDHKKSPHPNGGRSESNSKVFLRFFDLVSGWRKCGSMIKFERNFEYFIPYYAKYLASWQGRALSSVSLDSLWKLSKRFNKIFSTRGINDVILRFKIINFVINAYIGGQRLVTTQDLGLRIKLVNGLPAILPPLIRSYIRSNDLTWVRTFSSLFQGYKGIQGIYKDPDFSSISAPTFHRDSWLEVQKLAPIFWKVYNILDIKANLSMPFDFDRKVLPEHYVSTKAGPNGVSITSAHLDALAWTGTIGWTYSALYRWLKETENDDLLFYINKLSDMARAEGHNPDALRLAKVSLKYEAAGKIRIFAIVDFWTQYVLKPLHKAIFKILKTIPMDATFDQVGAVKEFSLRGYKDIYSFDLKSATDIIPKRLYVELLTPWLGETLSSLWGQLFDRYYHYIDRKSPHKSRKLIYTRGQPMGALSSWAALALVHHFVVFLSALRVNKMNFKDYLVLGDDIVIADKEVANSYLEVCKDYGIIVGLPKSFISSEGFFQFASQNLKGANNISPISLKEVLSVRTLSERLEFALRTVSRYSDVPKLSCLINAFYSFKARRIIQFDFYKGVLPPLVGNHLALLLFSDKLLSLNNAANFDRIFALLQGKYSGVIGRDYVRTKELDSLMTSALSEVKSKIFQNIKAQSLRIKDFFGDYTYFLGMSRSNIEAMQQINDDLREVKPYFDMYANGVKFPKEFKGNQFYHMLYYSYVYPDALISSNRNMLLISYVNNLISQLNFETLPHILRELMRIHQLTSSPVDYFHLYKEVSDYTPSLDRLSESLLILRSNSKIRLENVLNPDSGVDDVEYSLFEASSDKTVLDNES